MSVNDMFRRFFGFPTHRFPDEWQPENEYSPPFPDGPDRGQFADDADDMFHHFERHFQEVFRNFGFVEFSPSWIPDGFAKGEMRPGLPPADEVPLRDRLLKRPDSKHGYDPVEVPTEEPNFQQREMPWFKGLFDHRKQEGDGSSLLDQDLDTAVSKDGLDLILKNPPDRAARLPTHSYFSSSSVTVRGADGKVEERCTKRDGFGNEETSIRRQFGDRVHGVVTRKDKDGKQEHEEHFTNMDQTNVGEFEKKWNTGNINSPDCDSSSGLLHRLFKNFY